MRMRNGQTMIEMIFAIGIIGIGLLAATTLVFSNLALEDRDKDEVSAINLAREGLELGKNLRDSNWLAGNSFDTGMVGTGSDYTATPEWNGISNSNAFDFTANDFTDPRTKVMSSASAGAVYFLANWEPGFSGTSSTFSRLVTFHPICSDFTTVLNSGAACTDSGKIKVGVRVESHVRWMEQSVQKDTVMYDDLYDWR